MRANMMVVAGSAASLMLMASVSMAQSKVEKSAVIDNTQMRGNINANQSTVDVGGADARPRQRIHRGGAR